MSTHDEPQQVPPILSEVTEEEAGQRLDQWVATRPGVTSRVRAKAIIKAGDVRMLASGAQELPDDGGQRIKDASRKVRRGETFAVHLTPATPYALVPQAIALDVVFEDDALIVINKPAGMVVHPAAGHPDGTLVNALLHHCGESLSGVGGTKRPGILHRLDKDTSGLLVVAKHDEAHLHLAAQFASHGADGRLVRAYEALAWGIVETRHHRIELPIARDPTTRLKMAVAKRAELGKRAVTHVAPLAFYNDKHGAPYVSHVRCALETGRTHQIRVHLAAVGHPLLSDPVYGTHFAASINKLEAAAGDRVRKLARQALHAATLGFVHPMTGETLQFSAALPPDMRAVVDALAAC